MPCEAINQTVLDDKRFYAYGSPPTQTSNETAYLVAVEQVWPVITLFGQLGADGTRSSLNTTAQCIRAFDGTTNATDPVSAAGRAEVSRLLLAAGLGVLVPYFLAF